MTKKELFDEIKRKKSYLCVGLDSDIRKIPKHLLETEDPIFEFNKAIIDATADHCVAYKPNIAFYEAMGAKGWQSLEKTLNYIPKNCFTIADAKRGDIGNTSGLYARTFFDKSSSGLDFDSVTVAPYMGKDSVSPFLEFDNKWVILLALTSNQGSQDFQHLVLGGNDEEKEPKAKSPDVMLSSSKHRAKLYEQVLLTSQTWGTNSNMMYVVGATQAHELSRVRAIVPNHFLLVPGVGAQGGSLEEVSRFGMNAECGLLVNSARAIIYASSGKDFAEQARIESQKVQTEMERYLEQYL